MFEYKVIFPTKRTVDLDIPFSLQRFLNDMGKEEWELVQLDQLTEHYLRFIFKRKVAPNGQD